MTLSIGVSQYRPADSEDDLIARADAALYAAKHAGRNCVQLESDGVTDNAAERNVA
ncbi:MAG: diguanylate cyclase [Alphaproteobacteria bacterium]|nr:diguanylate cyclase [Alphaproteobacteria bacterium]